MKVCLLLLAATVSFAQDAAEQIKKIDRQWSEATLHRDSAALDRILGDDLRYVHGNASIQNKKEFIDSLKTGDLVYHSMDYDELDARVFGDTGILTSKMRMSITMNKQEQKFAVRFLRVYVKRKGSWQLVAHQATRVP